ncbi:sensor histidine kinase [Romboutsia ilealis]|uniref:histidine kinase n=2 Tax=Romboutsia faecis TaxID=2764597 RepID=A0ABR7JSK6_9FIRM|nr:sensor histidine kinase [Romboutsia faecis]MBC5997899.1 sensor histidine kinase [Romboutsia faecis]MRN25594.1 sensor histidine kinase [Romboutsia ilealis]
MTILQYIKDKSLFLIINLILFFIVFIISIYTNISIQFIIVIFMLWFLPLISYIILEFIKFNKYYKNVVSICDSLDKKYLLSEIIEEPDFAEGKILYDLLSETNRSMRESINYYKNIQKEYEEYIEMWIHEIKTPIASTLLLIENNIDIMPLGIKEQIKNIENYVEQVLYYSKINDVNKDYIVKSVNLELVVKNVIRKNASDFINKKISINLDDINENVYTDSKWIEFIINQIISNSIKYSVKISPKISINLIKNENNTILTIEDNGVGITDKDIRKVFEKGFTGNNGRKFGRSTGMGLYICKKLCDKLGIGINLISKENEGTKISLAFPYDKNRTLVK